MLAGKALENAFNNFIYRNSENLELDPGTIENKMYALKGLLGIVGAREFNYDTAEEFRQFKYLTWKMPNSKRNVTKNLRNLINWLFENELIEKNFSHRLRMPKDRSEPEPLPTIEEAEACLVAGFAPTAESNVMHRRQKELMLLAGKMALRNGIRGDELGHIRGKDMHIDLNRPEDSKVFLVKAKGGVPQWQPLPVDLLEELSKRKNEERVFPFSLKRFNQNIKRGAVLTGLRPEIVMDMHILRKVFGTTMARFITMSKVARLMRHSDISITQKFYIQYGITELGHDLTINHPLIRIALPPEEDIREFINNIAAPHFKNRNFQLNESYENGEVVLRIRYQ